MRGVAIVGAYFSFLSAGAFAQAEALDAQSCVWRCGAEKRNESAYNSCARTCMQAVSKPKKTELLGSSVLDGKWASSLKECSSPEPVRYVFFQGDTYGGPEFGCKVKTKATSKNRFSLKGRCDYGDEKWNISLSIKREANRILISGPGQGAAESFYFCKKSEKAN